VSRLVSLSRMIWATACSLVCEIEIWILSTPSSFIFNLTARSTLTLGAPCSSFPISISVHEMSPRHPVPSAFNKASLAAYLPAKLSAAAFPL